MYETCLPISDWITESENNKNSHEYNESFYYAYSISSPIDDSRVLSSS
jgi:hypothetical protein